MARSTVLSLTPKERAELLEAHLAGKSLEEVWARARELSPKLSRTALWRYLNRMSRDNRPASRADVQAVSELIEAISGKIEDLGKRINQALERKQ